MLGIKNIISLHPGVSLLFTTNRIMSVGRFVSNIEQIYHITLFVPQDVWLAEGLVRFEWGSDKVPCQN